MKKFLPNIKSEVRKGLHGDFNEETCIITNLEEIRELLKEDDLLDGK